MKYEKISKTARSIVTFILLSFFRIEQFFDTLWKCKPFYCYALVSSLCVFLGFSGVFYIKASLPLVLLFLFFISFRVRFYLCFIPLLIFVAYSTRDFSYPEFTFHQLFIYLIIMLLWWRSLHIYSNDHYAFIKSLLLIFVLVHLVSLFYGVIYDYSFVTVVGNIVFENIWSDMFKSCYSIYRDLCGIILLMELFDFLLVEHCSDVSSFIADNGMLMMDIKKSSWSIVRGHPNGVSSSDLFGNTELKSKPFLGKVHKTIDVNDSDKLFQGSKSHFALIQPGLVGVLTKSSYFNKAINLGFPILTPMRVSGIPIDSFRDIIDSKEFYRCNNSELTTYTQYMVIYKLESGIKDLSIKDPDNSFLKELSLRENLMENDFIELKYKLLSKDPLIKDELASSKFDSYLSSLNTKDLNDLWLNHCINKPSLEDFECLVGNIKNMEVFYVDQDYTLFSKSIVRDFENNIKCLEHQDK